MHDVRYSERQLAGQLLENPFRGWVVFRQGGGKMLRLPAPLAGGQAPQRAGLAFCRDLPDARIDRPTGATRLKCGPLPVQPQMPDLGFARSFAVVDLPLRDQAATDATAQGNIENAIEPGPGAMQRLAQGRDVGIVIGKRRHAGELLQPVRQVKTRPALDLVRAGNPAGAPIDRTAETGTYSADLVTPEQVQNGVLKLPANARRTEGRLDREAPSLKDFGRVVSEDNLEFCPADLDG